MDLGLNGRRRTKQEVLCTRPDFQHEVEQIIGFVFFWPSPPRLPRLMRLIKNHRTVFPLKQIPTFTGVMDNQAGGDNGDAKRTARISSAPRVLMICPLGSSQTFFLDDQTALGIPSLSNNSTCHCSVRVEGQRINTGPSPTGPKSWRLQPATRVLPTPTSSASSSRALP